jgi:hypothetical protein
MSAFDLDLGTNVLLETDGDAAAFLTATFSSKAWTKVQAGLREWVSGVPVKRARLSLAIDHDDPKWKELVVALEIESDEEPPFVLWEELAGVLAQAKEGLSRTERSKVDSYLAVELVRRGSLENVEPASTL